MAFPIPSHLPRKPTSRDVSSKILSKMDEATSQTLNSELAAAWLTELDETIQSTKNRIHERIITDLLYFDQQLSSCKSVQIRLQTLASNVENLSEAISHPETGVVSTLLKALTSHAALAQKATDATVAYDALSDLSRCRSELHHLSALVQEGKLPDAVVACGSLEKLLGETSMPLSQANVLVDLKRKFRSSKDRAEEQLSDSYSRSIIISPMEIEIHPSVQVRQSIAVLTLSSILSSLSPQYLTSHLTTLRRDLTTHYILYTLTQPTSIAITTSTSASHILAYKLTQFHAPPNTTHISTRLSNLSEILTFLSTHFFSCLPPSQLSIFSQSLCKPISDAVLTHLLIPAIPSSFARLPLFLDLVKQAVEFEDTFVVGMLGSHSNDRVIKNWADGVSGHYERKRRTEILEHARGVIMRAKEVKTFRVEAQTSISPAQVETEVEKETEVAEEDSQAWGFDDEETPNEDEEAETDGWGFDDDIQPEDNSPGPPAERETYMVSVRARELLGIVEDVLREGNEFALSGLFPSHLSSSSSAPGTILLQSASAVADLFRALNPVRLGEALGANGMQFSNDCLYLSRELGRLTLAERVVECKETLSILGDSFFDDTIEKKRQLVDGILAAVEGFTYTTEQERYDECEDAISKVVREIRAAARQWEGVLAKSKYYTAIGLVADAALSRILEDVLALPDITEVESHRLSELCRILNSLEGLFVEDTNQEQPSFVAAYVPSWLKFSYLSELLEASMADISYLFEEGALVDFTIDELTRLVRALFADTPLRATTINKLLGDDH